jgi:hypothetical protein
MTEIIQSAAQRVTLESDETFAQYADRVFRTRRPIQYKDGTPIEVDPNLQYSFLMLGLTRLATPEEFGVLYGIIMSAVAEAESQGIVPAGWIKTVGTPFDLIPKPVPSKFADEIPANTVIKTYIAGEMSYDIRLEILPPEEESEHEEPQEAEEDSEEEDA